MRLTLRQGVDRQNGHVVDGQGGQEDRAGERLGGHWP